MWAGPAPFAFITGRLKIFFGVSILLCASAQAQPASDFYKGKSF
jgi:hypothetical protein